MATYVERTEAAPASSDRGLGFVVGVILLVLALIALFVYGLPYVTGGLGGGTQVNLPSSVNVNTPAK